MRHAVCLVLNTGQGFVLHIILKHESTVFKTTAWLVTMHSMQVMNHMYLKIVQLNIVLWVPVWLVKTRWWPYPKDLFQLKYICCIKQRQQHVLNVRKTSHASRAARRNHTNKQQLMRPSRGLTVTETSSHLLDSVSSALISKDTTTLLFLWLQCVQENRWH